VNGPREALELVVHRPQVHDRRTIVDGAERAADGRHDVVERTRVADVQRHFVRRRRRLARRHEQEIRIRLPSIAAVQPVRRDVGDHDRLWIRAEPQHPADSWLTGPERGGEPLIDEGGDRAAVGVVLVDIVAGEPRDALVVA